MTQLISPVEDGDVRRAVPKDHLGPIAEDLAGTRLVTLGESTVEIAHEALVRHWDRLRDWVEEDREFRIWQGELDRPAQRWTHTEDNSLLPRGKTLRHARKMAWWLRCPISPPVSN